MTATIPSRIEWTGPSGWRLWADEDGVHIKTPHGDLLESCEVTDLIALVGVARGQIASGAVPVPKPLSRDELRDVTYDQREKFYAKIATKAVREAIAPTTPTTTDMHF